MVRFHRLAELFCAAAIAAAPGSAKDGVWPAEARSDATVTAPRAAPCKEQARQVGGQVPRARRAAAASFSPQRSQAELRDAAAAQIAKMWASG